MPEFEKQKNPNQSGFLARSAVRGRSMPKPAHDDNPLLAQQQALGNQAMQRFAESCPLTLPSASICPFGGVCHTCPVQVQTKLKINQPGDKYEQEADLVADEVMRMSDLNVSASSQSEGVPPAEHIQRLCPECEDELQRQPEEEEEEELLQAKEIPGQTTEINSSIETNINSVQSGGRPLPESARNYFEPRFGYDFSQVRVHTDAGAAKSAQTVNAQAYTLGRDIIFGNGNYSPETTPGRHLLAHELTHVVQQAGSVSLLQRQLARSPVGLETKAEEEDEETTKIITDGLKLVWDKLETHNPRFKKLVLDKVEDFAERKWDELPTADKVVLGGWGVGTVGMLGAALLTDESGRELLEDVNLATPFKLIPYMPLEEFSYKKAEGGEAQGYAYQFKVGLTAKKIMNKLREKHHDILPIGVDVELLWGFNPSTREIALTGGNIKVSLFKGIGITAGTVTGLAPIPEYYPTPGGGAVITEQRYPEPEAVKMPRGVQVMLTLDLAKMDWVGFSRKTKEFFRQFR